MTRRWFLALMVGVMFLAACGQSGSVPATGGQPGRAVVESVEIAQILKQSGQFSALVKGTLPDACTRLAEPVLSKAGNLVIVILEQQPLAGVKNCPAGAVPYERIIALGSELTPGRYTVSVNGVQAIFDLPAPAQAVSIAQVVTTTDSDPTAIPTTVQAAAAVTGSASTGLAAPTAMPTESTAPAEAAATTQLVAPTALSAPTAAPTASAASPAAQSTPAVQGSSGPAAAACENKAAFYADVTIPDGTTFDPGQPFTKTWQIRNAGSCIWTNYQLVFQDGDLLGAQSPVSVQGTISPGDLTNVSIKLTAPEKPGSYYSNWLLSSADGQTFGTGAGKNGLLWTRISTRLVIPVTANQPVCAYQQDPSVESQILQLINQARKAANLPAFKLNDALSTAARLHSQDMSCNDFVEHYGSDGSTWYTRIQAQGVRYKTANENIYAGDPQYGGTPQGAFTWWMNSQVHRDNILNPKSSQVGVGYVFYSGSTYKGYYTLNFIGK